MIAKISLPLYKQRGTYGQSDCPSEEFVNPKIHEVIYIHFP